MGSTGDMFATFKELQNAQTPPSPSGGTQSCVLDQENVDSPGETERHS